ncbi:hypothetical protein AVEN_119274-1 [Araneus ventricosus]|uniref:Uncharacterized protein n=1 Tax=Araneus ventricosus TaxID=182803 RepID=A0A4Y2EIV6_ARAVE|nr:hypothetical protein AVEN_119274-1 [Araneus ventricosus]
MDLVILNRGYMKRTTPELVPLLHTSSPHQRVYFNGIYVLRIRGDRERDRVKNQKSGVKKTQRCNHINSNTKQISSDGTTLSGYYVVDTWKQIALACNARQNGPSS